MDYWAIRPWRGPDADPLVLDSFCRALLASRVYSGITAEAWSIVRKRCLEPSLQRATVLVASADGCDDQIAGWCAVERSPLPIVHWVYVRKAIYRGKGFARMLLSQACVDLGGTWYAPHTSHHADRVQHILPGLVYAPHILGAIHEDHRGAATDGATIRRSGADRSNLRALGL